MDVIKLRNTSKKLTKGLGLRSKLTESEKEYLSKIKPFYRGLLLSLRNYRESIFSNLNLSDYQLESESIRDLSPDFIPFGYEHRSEDRLYLIYLDSYEVIEIPADEYIYDWEIKDYSQEQKGISWGEFLKREQPQRKFVIIRVTFDYSAYEWEIIIYK